MEATNATQRFCKTKGAQLGWARGVAVKCMLSTAGGPGLDPGPAPMHRLSGYVVVASHIKVEENGHRY